MGEAKRNLEELRARMIGELERLMTPTTPDEDALNDEIRALDFYQIHRVPDDVIAYMKMKPQQCHQNASAYVRLDPSGESRHVSGWWKRGGIFYCHSVILSQTKLHCITPHHDPQPLQFAPDFEISWIDEDGMMRLDRRGKRVPFLVRDYPEAVIAEATAARDALATGAHPRTIKMKL